MVYLTHETHSFLLKSPFASGWGLFDELARLPLEGLVELSDRGTAMGTGDLRDCMVRYR